MSEIENAIMAFGGHCHRDCYYILCMAICIVRECRSERPPQMKSVWIEICHRTKRRKPASVSRAAARAVSDIWDFGDRELLGLYCHSWVYRQPSPQEFIYVVARKLQAKDGQAI